jgi:hypothetical protein
MSAMIGEMRANVTTVSCGTECPPLIGAVQMIVWGNKAAQFALDLYPGRASVVDGSTAVRCGDG